jgi:hypothetical protein
LGRTLLVRLIGPRLEPAFVATRLTRITRITLLPRITGITRFARLTRVPRLVTRIARLLTVARVTRLTRLSRITLFAWIERALLATIAFPTIGTEGGPFITPAFRLRGRLTGGRWARVTRFPAYGSTLGLLGRENLQFRFVRRLADVRHRRARRRQWRRGSNRSGLNRSGSWNRGWGWGGSGLFDRLVGTGRAHGSFSRERIFVLTGRRDHFDRRGLIPLSGGG